MSNIVEEICMTTSRSTVLQEQQFGEQSNLIRSTVVINNDPPAPAVANNMSLRETIIWLTVMVVGILLLAVLIHVWIGPSKDKPLQYSVFVHGRVGLLDDDDGGDPDEARFTGQLRINHKPNLQYRNAQIE